MFLMTRCRGCWVSRGGFWRIVVEEHHVTRRCGTGSCPCATAPAAELIGPDSGQAVLRALSALREPDREALLLVAWEGLEPGRAARVLGVRPNTFAARLSRARRRFARALADDRGGSDREHRTVQAEVLP